MRPRWLNITLVVALVVGGACKKGTSGGDDAKTIRIGVITSLTGTQAAFGQAHKHGYTIAVNDINAKGGVLGKPVEVLFYDDQSTTTSRRRSPD